MPEQEPPLPTKAELAILDVLWRRGPSTVRGVLDVLTAKRDTNYPTVLKLLQLMHGKGLVDRDASSMRHVYSARQAPRETRRRLLDDMVERGFAGSAKALILQALGDGRASPEELEEIGNELRRYLEETGR